MILRVDTYWEKLFEPLMINLLPREIILAICSDIRILVYKNNAKMIANKVSYYVVIGQ